MFTILDKHYDDAQQFMKNGSLSAELYVDLLTYYTDTTDVAEIKVRFNDFLTKAQQMFA